jgi:hypothetical protein
LAAFFARSFAVARLLLLDRHDLGVDLDVLRGAFLRDRELRLPELELDLLQVLAVLDRGFLPDVELLHPLLQLRRVLDDMSGAAVFAGGVGSRARSSIAASSASRFICLMNEKPVTSRKISSA